MKKILIINGHPNVESFNYALSKAYRKGALGSGAEVRQIDITNLDFDTFELKSLDSFKIPKDLEKAQKDIKWSEHIVFVHPIWWGTLPAILKSFFEQTFLMGFAAQFEPDGKITKLLTGKTARIISTLDTPVWIFKYLLKDPSFKTHKANLNFCGIKPVKGTYYSPIVKSTKEQREKWLKETEQLGKQLK